MTFPTGVITRLIPDRANRSLWWLFTVSLASLGLTGPFWGSVITIQITRKSYWPEVIRALVANTSGIVVATAVLALLLRGRTERSTAARDLGLVTIATLIGAFVRLGAGWLVGLGYQPMGPFAIFASFLPALSGLAFAAVAILYAGQRERQLEQGFRDTAAAQAALAREEEDVRGRIFDQLHGTLQAGLVDVRRQLVGVAEELPTPQRDVLLGIEARLAELYAADVAGLAGSLYPAGLELGLLPALRQLVTRAEGTIEVRLDVDSFTTVLDDSQLGGLNREVRFAVFRIVEECVVNAMRHGTGDWVEIGLRTTLAEGGPVIEITSRNSVSESREVVPGHGLSRMRSRASSLGGSVELTSGSETFVVAARVPVQRA